MKKSNIFLFIIGIIFIIVGAFTIIKDFSKEEEPEPVKPVKKENIIEENLINTCWNNEILAEETSNQRKKLICFDDSGGFTYKYVKEGDTVEGFETYKKFTYDDSRIIKLISDDKEVDDLEVEVYSVTKGNSLTLKYDNRLVYFIYYCRL